MEYNPFTLKNKIILVTGSSSGIGRQCAIRCSEMGGKIVLMGRNEERLKETFSHLEGEDHLILPIDLLDFTELEELIRQITGKAGKISGVINCAGISTTLPFSQSKPDKMENFLKTNVIGSMNLTRIVIKKEHFSDHGGSIVFISSVMGSAGEKGKSLYGMTKGAIDSAVRSLAIEFSGRQIRFNSISPGVVETPMSKNAIYSKDEESLNKIKSLHPLGIGLPDDVANTCIFLLSDAARWITGTNLVVDGGYLAR